MPSLSAADILDIWESGRGAGPVERSLILLACHDHWTRDELDAISLGRRDAGLLEVRRDTFGDAMRGAGVCVKCGQQVEFTASVTSMLAEACQDASPDFRLSVDDMVLHCRPPNSADLAAALEIADRDEARQELLRRCIMCERGDGRQIPPGELPESAVDLAARRIAELDPLAEMLFEGECPSCGHRWELVFDVSSFLWAEITAEARRLMYEVHALASAYGWSEADILSMSAVRRQFYLGLIG